MSSHYWLQRVVLGSFGLALTLTGPQPLATAVVHDHQPVSVQVAVDEQGLPTRPHRPSPDGRSERTTTYAKGQLLVKFKSSLTKCAHCLFSKKQRFATALTDFSQKLDRLNQEAGVTSIEPLYPQSGIRSGRRRPPALISRPSTPSSARLPNAAPGRPRPRRCRS